MGVLRGDTCFSSKVLRVRNFEFNDSNVPELKVDIYWYLPGQLLSVKSHNGSSEPGETVANLGGHAGK